MTANPVWSQDAELALPPGAGASEVARVSVWDKRVDRMKLMGMAIFPLSALGNFARKEMELHLEHLYTNDRGEKVMTYAFSPIG